MTYICTECPNKTRFRRTQYGSCNYSEEVYLDENGEIDDYGDTEYDDHNIHDSGDETICSECDSSATSDVTEEEWRDWLGPIPKNWKEKMESD